MKIKWKNTYAALVRDGKLRPVRDIAKIELDSFVNLQSQIEQLELNTIKFIEHGVINHALLWGERGCGKSSLVRGIFCKFIDKNLRLIEINPSELNSLYKILDKIRDKKKYKFIIFCDDFGFENADKATAYCDLKGMPVAREAICEYHKSKGIEGITPDDCFIGNGVSELITMSMQGLLDNGDEILVPAPDYPLWTAAVNLAGGTAVHYICDEEAEWNPDIDDIKKKITDRTKAIVIINPNNPTGALYSKDVLQQIVKVAREHQLIIFSDEIYDRLIFNDEEHTSIAALAPDLFCVTFSGLSKSHMVAGYRVGWMVLSGNKRMAKDYIEGLNMLSNMRLCSNVPAQSIVQTSLGGYQSVKNYIKPGGRVYEQCEYIYKALNKLVNLIQSASSKKAC